MQVLRQVSGSGVFGKGIIGTLGTLIPFEALWRDIALQYPDALIKGIILNRDDSLPFDEEGRYTIPASRKVLTVAIYLNGVFLENRSYSIGRIKQILRQISGSGVFGIGPVGVLLDEIPLNSPIRALAEANPDSLHRVSIITTNDTQLRFDETGAIISSSGPNG